MTLLSWLHHILLGFILQRIFSSLYMISGTYPYHNLMSGMKQISFRRVQKEDWVWIQHEKKDPQTI